MNPVEKAIKVLVEHQDMTDRSATDGCSCGEPASGRAYVQHVAELLASAGALGQPDEPMGITARVNGGGFDFVRLPSTHTDDPRPWICENGTRWKWSEIIAGNHVTVLGEGVES